VAARRLVIVMLVLLGVSGLAAALVPPPPVDEAERERRPEVVAPPAPAPGGELVNAGIDASEDEPEEIRIGVGDQLALTVRSGVADQVEIPALGELEFVGPLAPARFDLIAREEASYAVRLVDADRVVGRIEVRRPEPDRERGDAAVDPGSDGKTDREERSR